MRGIELTGITEAIIVYGLLSTLLLPYVFARIRTLLELQSNLEKESGEDSI